MFVELMMVVLLVTLCVCGLLAAREAYIESFEDLRKGLKKTKPSKKQIRTLVSAMSKVTAIVVVIMAVAGSAYAATTTAVHAREELAKAQARELIALAECNEAAIALNMTEESVKLEPSSNAKKDLILAKVVLMKAQLHLANQKNLALQARIQLLELCK